MIQILIIVLSIMAGNVDEGAAVWELERLESAHHYYSENWQFEDGSFIRTINGESYSGCIPFALCSDIQNLPDLLDLLD